MNKLLKLFGVALLATTMFGCEDSSGWSVNNSWNAEVGDTFTVARVYDSISGNTTFDFTGLRLNDSSAVEVETSYVHDTDTNSNEMLLFAGIEFDEDDCDITTISWEVDGAGVINHFKRDNVTTDIYKQTFNHSESPDIDFDIGNKATKTLISVTDLYSGYEYHLEGNHNGTGVVTVVSIDKD